MPFLRYLKSLVLKADLFYSNSLLRVRGQPEHTTLIGGILSLTLMIFLATAFSNKIIDTLNKAIISSTSTDKNADDPIPFNISTLDSGTFMMGIQILNYNLNAPTRAFDIILRNTIYQYGVIQNISIEEKLQPCTREHWNGYPQIQKKYNNLGIGNWLCLPKNRKFQIKGKYSSAQSKTLDIIARKCTANHIDTRPCATQTEVDKLFNDNDGNLFFSVYFLNPLINPDSQEYLTYYLEDSYYISFSQTGGEESRLLVQDYQIVTDQSILPITDLMTQTGGVIMDSPLKTSFFTINHTYGTFYFFKSPISLYYTRQFQKIDEVFSYIGGLFGTILIAFFLMSIYNTHKYQISLSGYMYRDENKQRYEKGYNFIYYLGQMVYTVLKMVKIRPTWKRLGFYYETRQEMLKQLDVLLLLKRINFLQKSLGLLFSEHQMVGLHLATQFTMSEAVLLRKRYKLKAKLKAELEAQRRKKSSEKSMKADYSKQQIIVTDSVEDSVEGGHREREEHDEHQFHSDRYTQQSSDDEHGEGTSVLQSAARLRDQKDDNPISAKIWRSLDERLKVHITSTSKNREDLQYQQQLPAQKFYPDQTSRNSGLIFDHQSDPEPDQISQASQHNKQQAMVLFKQLKVAQVEQEYYTNQ